LPEMVESSSVTVSTFFLPQKVRVSSTETLLKIGVDAFGAGAEAVCAKVLCAKTTAATAAKYLKNRVITFLLVRIS
jgi:hypothetical protein